MKKFVAIAIFILMLSGCSSISSGYITKKTYEPSYTYSVMVCSVYIKSQCAAYTPIIETEPEHWKFDLKNGDKIGWVYVDKDVYDDMNVGDVYNKGEN